MTLPVFLSFIVDTLGLGSQYALLALGLVVVYGIMGLVNFAYGEYIMVGCYVLYLIGLYANLPWPAAFALAIIAAALLGLLTEMIAFRPLRGRSLDALLVTSFAISVILQNVFLIGISPRYKSIPYPAFFDRRIDIFGVVTSLRSYIFIAVTLLLLIALTLLMKKTVLGMAMRAASENFVTARLMGVPANLVISSAFLISGLLAGVVAIFWTAKEGMVGPTSGVAPLLIAFIAVVIGGMHSLPGAVLGGYVYAFLTNALGLWLPPGLSPFREAFMFVLVILFLLLRPEGLIRGNYTEERVG
ncbi:MAG: branched-chain amino acid ABC transporter permease [Coriobacteriia bacterium]|nr:branched-chain amino acid ABC transporter permease [Coriobacteriia bacterium]